MVRKINVFFSKESYDGFDTLIPIAAISPAQLKQLQETIANETIPAAACPTCIEMKYNDTISFLDGGARCDKMACRRRTLEISDLFYLAPTSKKIACTNQRVKSEISALKKCAQNLRTGKCHDEFMRRTLGAILFPRLYTAQKEK